MRETERAERVAQILHDEVIAPQTPGLTALWMGQPVSYRLEAMRSPIVLQILAVFDDPGYSL